MERASYRLLVVDDYEENRDLLVALLSEQGHRCTPAGDGVEAMAKISEGKFDAVITDVVMPNMDGITLTKQIARHYPSLPIMTMTGNGQVDIHKARRRHSAGMGLTFCKLAVEAHDGRIGLESEAAKGSTFWFVLTATRDRREATSKTGRASHDSARI